MNAFSPQGRTRAQESSNAIQRMYITMRHLFHRGFYKPLGVSGDTLRDALLTLRPEIYGTIAEEEKVELNGLLYVMDRLPYGIENCRFINLTSEEGYKNSHFKAILPVKRRRNCYRIDQEQMNIEITRGRSDIYDILTHLTFLSMESHKIMKQVLLNDQGQVTRDWHKLEKAVFAKKALTTIEREIALTHTANILGRTFEEIMGIYDRFACPENKDRFLHIIYGLGKLAIDESVHDQKRIITFSPILRERLGHHIHGAIWAEELKSSLANLGLLQRPLHIISANMHSVMNCLYAQTVLSADYPNLGEFELYELLSNPSSNGLRSKVNSQALKMGMTLLADESGTNIDVQLFDASKFTHGKYFKKLKDTKLDHKPVLIVMDYAFGEQAYETLDELLRPYETDTGTKTYLDVKSISIMGKAGILDGGKGDIMIPNAHVFEGTADNYPFTNQLTKKDLEGEGISIYDGTMITVLGTSLQNKDLLKFFHESTWNVIGLEMEGAHYQKAIQAASKIRGSIQEDVKIRYAYYASDNPLKTGSTLASGGLGIAGVKPTYLITEKILDQIFS